MVQVNRVALGFMMALTVACGGAGDDNATTEGTTDAAESALSAGERLSYRGYWANGTSLETGRVVFTRAGGLPVFGPEEFLQDRIARGAFAFRAPSWLGGGVRVIEGDMKCSNDYTPAVHCRLYADDQYGNRFYFDFRQSEDGSPDRVKVSSDAGPTFSTTYGPAEPTH
jgi:hypothetical protein